MKWDKLKQKHVKYLIEVLVLSIVIMLMSKFIPFRGRPLPAWSVLLCDLPIIVIISFLVSIFHFSNFITHKDGKNKRKNDK